MLRCDILCYPHCAHPNTCSPSLLPFAAKLPMTSSTLYAMMTGTEPNQTTHPKRLGRGLCPSLRALPRCNTQSLDLVATHIGHSRQVPLAPGREGTARFMSFGSAQTRGDITPIQIPIPPARKRRFKAHLLQAEDPCPLARIKHHGRGTTHVQA